MKNLLTITSVLLLAACADMHNPMPKTSESFVSETKDNTRPWRAKVADVIFPEVKHEYLVDTAPVVVVHPFCYKTWDKPVCYDRPELGQEARLVGSTN